MNARFEYGNHDHENGNGNGGPKFSIAKAPPDPETLAIFEARRNAFAEPRRRMDRSKYMFAELCDRATNTRGPGFIRKGSVIVPDSEFARLFGVWESTIYTWKKQLEFCGYIWTSKQRRSDRWPITIYHIAAIHPRPNHETQNRDGTSNAGPGRPGPGAPGELTPKGKTWSAGARKPGQKSLPLASPVAPPVPWNAPQAKLKISSLLAIGAVKFDLHWLPATAGTGSQPQPAPADSHGPHRLTATASNGAQPRPNVADSHGSDGATATAKRVQKRVSVGRVETSKGGRGEPPPDLGMEDFKKQWRGSYKRERAPILSKLKADKAQAAEEHKAWFQERIDFLTWLDTGGRPPAGGEKPKPKAKAPAAEPAPLSDAELVAHADYCREHKREHMLSPEMKKRLAALEVGA